MPYIPQYLRRLAEQGKGKETAAVLNYRISLLVNAHILHNGLSYNTINDIVGALECAKLEAYRRIAAPYEDQKLAENGDVY